MKKTVVMMIAMMAVALVSCTDKGRGAGNGGQDGGTQKETTVYFLPFDDFKTSEVERLKKDFREKFNPLVSTNIQFEILPSKSLPPTCLNSKKSRYRATKILDWEEDNITIPDDCIVIGLTHKDISTTAHNVDDYGIMGCAYMGSQVCIVSDYRVRNKHDLWKVASHEFIHAYYDYDHCPDDDPTCIIKDAKGKENLKKKHHLCKTCSQNLK